MDLFNTPIGSPILIGLTVGYFVTSSISTFDTRLIQAKRAGTLPVDEPVLPQWVGVIVLLDWGLALSLLLLNWKYAIVVFLARFVLKVLPVLETVGNMLMAPFAPGQRARAEASTTPVGEAEISDVDERPPAGDEDSRESEPRKTVDEALFELALICALPQSPWLEIFVGANLEIYTPQHFVICREAAAYLGGRLWSRVKGEMSQSEQGSRIAGLAGKVAQVLTYGMREKGFSETEIEAQVDPDMKYAIQQGAEYAQLGPDVTLLYRKFETSLASTPELCNVSSITAALAKAFEFLFDRWAKGNPCVFVPSALSSCESTELPGGKALSFREAVDIGAGFGSLYADLNDARIVFKPESRLPASRETIKAALKISLQCDPQMSEEHRNAHNFMYPQLALFVPDSDAERANAFTRKPYIEVIGGQEIEGLSAIDTASAHFGALHLMGNEHFLKTLEWFGNKFYNSEYFAGRDSPDARFMRSLAMRCWTDMWALVRDWREFVNAQNL